MSALFSNGEMVGGSVENTNFTSSDVADGQATSWTSVTPIVDDEPNVSLFTKLSQIAKNVRYLYKMLGTTDISAIGNGTVTDGISTLNNAMSGKQPTLSFTRTSGPSANLAISAGVWTIIVSPIELPAGTYLGFASAMSKDNVNNLSYLRIAKSNDVNTIYVNEPYFGLINGKFTLSQRTAVALWAYSGANYTTPKYCASMWFIKIA